MTRIEDELRERYGAAGFDVRALEDVGAAILTSVADDDALVGTKPRGLLVQLRNRYRFRGRLTVEVEQLLYEALPPLVHNAAVCGFRAGAPDERLGQSRLRSRMAGRPLAETARRWPCTRSS